MEVCSLGFGALATLGELGECWAEGVRESTLTEDFVRENSEGWAWCSGSQWFACTLCVFPSLLLVCNERENVNFGWWGDGEGGSRRSWEREHHDQNIRYKNLFSINIECLTLFQFYTDNYFWHWIFFSCPLVIVICSFSKYLILSLMISLFLFFCFLLGAGNRTQGLVCTRHILF